MDFETDFYLASKRYFLFYIAIRKVKALSVLAYFIKILRIV